MKDRRSFPRRGALLRDGLVGLVAFAGIVLVVAGGPDGWSVSSAAASAPPAVLASPQSIGRIATLAAPGAGDVARTVLLGVTFALLFAFNAAVLRHLRRVYASPRRDGWRRGR